MNNKQWLALIEEKREEILAAGEQAFKNSIDETHLKYTVAMYAYGEIDTWYTLAGQNSFTISSYNGTSIVLMSFCNQDFDVPSNVDKLCEMASNKGIIVEALDEDGEDLMPNELYAWFEEEHKELINEYEKEYREFYKEEYAYQEAESKLDRLIETLENECE